MSKRSRRKGIFSLCSSRNSCILLAAAALGVLIFLACERLNNYPGIDELIARYADCQPDEYLARQLIANRVVFIADQQPGEWRYRKTIVDFLDYWSEQAINGNANDSLSSVSLILDADSAHVESIKRYIKSWDFAEFRDVHVSCQSGFTTADIEFYWRLGNVQHRIIDYNLRADSVNRLTFKIEAGRAKNGPASENGTRNGEHNLVSAEFIAEYSRQNPGTKSLAFFNADDLQRRFPSDNPNKTIEADSSIITLLGNIWDQPQNMVIIGSAPTNCWTWFRDELEAPLCDYAITDPATAQIINREAELTVCKIDGLIISDPDESIHLSINRIPSMNIVDCFIAGLPELEDIANSRSQQDLSAVIAYLDAVSGIASQRVNIRDSEAINATIRSWQRWGDSTQVDIVSDVLSLKLWTRLIDRIPEGPSLMAAHYDEEVMRILPGAPEFDNRFGAPTRAERAAQLRSYVNRAHSEIIIRTLINILWVGTLEEKSAAFEALAKETGISLGTAREWSEWYRSGKKESFEAGLLN